jgi:hypothetical protein
MTFQNKLMVIGNLIIFLSLISSLIYRDISFILLGLILIVFLIYINDYNNSVSKEKIETLDVKSHAIINNKVCIKPNKENPFMNPNIIDYDNLNNNIKSCDIDNNKIQKSINNYFKLPVYKDVIDIYDKNFSERQFYTMPATTIPNDQESLGKWLYGRKKTCKENNGEQCYNNIM